jgi:threonine dehydratase
MVTPHQEYPHLAKKLGLGKLYFKREDLHPYGSHKGRSIPSMIDHYCKSGNQSFAISSSGNAALAAALHTKKLNDQEGMTSPVNLDIFVGNNISPHKLDKIRTLTDANIKISQVERPLQALAQSVSAGKISLRQSTDDIALVGYRELAEEITEIGGIGAVFIGTSSGTTAQALARYFLENKLPIQVHIVQTSSCHPIIDDLKIYDISDIPEEKSDADAIVDISVFRKNVLVPLIKETGGTGWLATNDDIHSAIQLVKENIDLQISSNSALSVVGAMKAAKTNYETNGAVLCLICGD